MPTPLTITVDASALSALAATLQDGPARLRSLTRRVMTKQMQWAERRVKQRVSGEVLNVRTGRLRAGLAGEVEEDAAGITGRLGVLKGNRTLVYAAIQEYGGTVVPRRARVLTIPLAAVLTPAGVARFTAREAGEKYFGTFWKRSRAGNLILFGKTAGGELVPLFLGLTRVVIKEKRYLRDTVDEVLPRIRDEIQTAVLTAVAASRGTTIQ